MLSKLIATSRGGPLALQRQVTMAMTANSKFNLVNTNYYSMFTTTRMLGASRFNSFTAKLASQNATLVANAQRFFASRSDDDSSDFEPAPQRDTNKRSNFRRDNRSGI